MRHTEKKPRKKTPSLRKAESLALLERVKAANDTLPPASSPEYRLGRKKEESQFYKEGYHYRLYYTSADGFIVGRLMLRKETASIQNEVLRFFYDNRGFLTTVTLPCKAFNKEYLEMPSEPVFGTPRRALPLILSKIPFREGDIIILEDETLNKRGIRKDLERNWGYGGNTTKIIHRLFNDQKFETLRKIGLPNKDLFGYYYDKLTNDWYRQTIQMLNAKKDYDIGTWIDYLQMLKRLKKDVNNPTVYLPDDLKRAHNKLVVKLNKDAARERRKQRLEDDKEEMKSIDEKEKAIFRQKMERFSKIQLENDSFRVTTLDEIDKHFEDSVLLEHCLFHNHYYEKNDTLVVRISRKETPNKPYADAEINFRTGEILQLYGKLNCLLPKEEDQAVKTLIRENINRYLSAGKKTAQRPLLNVESFNPVFNTIRTS